MAFGCRATARVLCFSVLLGKEIPRPFQPGGSLLVSIDGSIFVSANDMDTAWQDKPTRELEFVYNREHSRQRRDGSNRLSIVANFLYFGCLRRLGVLLVANEDDQPVK